MNIYWRWLTFRVISSFVFLSNSLPMGTGTMYLSIFLILLLPILGEGIWLLWILYLNQFLIFSNILELWNFLTWRYCTKHDTYIPFIAIFYSDCIWIELCDFFNQMLINIFMIRMCWCIIPKTVIGKIAMYTSHSIILVATELSKFIPIGDLIYQKSLSLLKLGSDSNKIGMIIWNICIDLICVLNMTWVAGGNYDNSQSFIQ